MELNETKKGPATVTEPPENHTGYCPVAAGRALGRYKYYEVARKHSPVVVRYKDLRKYKVKRPVK